MIGHGASVLAVLAITPREYLVGLLVDVVAAILVFRAAGRFRDRWGSTPGGVPPMGWGVIIVLLGVVIGGIAYVVAARVTMRRAPARARMRPEPAAVGAPPPVAGWYRDPSGRHELRHWDGRGWSEHVMDAGARSTDRL